jgi:hypothetical protein
VGSLSLGKAQQFGVTLIRGGSKYFISKEAYKYRIGRTDMPIEVKNFSTQADEAKDMPNARMEAVNVLGQRVMKLTLAPDWKWSTDIKPIVGTPSCQATHTGIIVEGTIHCVCDDGSEATYSAGEAYAISPNHDAWCVGGKRAVVYEFAGMWGE